VIIFLGTYFITPAGLFKFNFIGFIRQAKGSKIKLLFQNIIEICLLVEDFRSLEKLWNAATDELVNLWEPNGSDTFYLV
jgi:hypothetical protein